MSRPAPESLLWSNPSPGTEEPEENRRSRLPSGGARAWSTSLDARNIGEGERDSDSPRGMALLSGTIVTVSSKSFVAGVVGGELFTYWVVSHRERVGRF